MSSSWRINSSERIRMTVEWLLLVERRPDSTLTSVPTATRFRIATLAKKFFFAPTQSVKPKLPSLDEGTARSRHER